MRDQLRLALVVAVAAATLIAVIRREPAAVPPAAAPQVARALPRPQATAPAVADALPEAPPPALADQVDALVATRDPARAWQAYQLLAKCASFNRDGDRIIFDTQAGDALPGMRGMTAAEKAHEALLCRGMTERMRQSRLDYLATAAQAGVPGAAIAMATEGPFGDRTALATRPDDPLVRQWQASVHAQLTRAADDGDLGVLHYLAGMHTSADAPLKTGAAESYRYGLALGLIARDVNGPKDAMGALYSAGGSLMQTIGAELNEAQRATEAAAATRILERDRARRQQSGKF
jgi:hypothetical protein